MKLEDIYDVTGDFYSRLREWRGFAWHCILIKSFVNFWCVNCSQRVVARQLSTKYSVKCQPSTTRRCLFIEWLISFHEDRSDFMYEGRNLDKLVYLLLGAKVAPLSSSRTNLQRFLCIRKIQIDGGESFEFFVILYTL